MKKNLFYYLQYYKDLNPNLLPMTSLHYPSLELCKKLTEAGFPETQLWIFDTRKSWKKYNCPYVSEYEEPKFIPFWNIKIWESELEITDFKNNPSAWYNESLPLVCPSVMELLDEIPKDIKWCWATIVKNYSGWYVRFEWEYAPMWMAWDRWQCDSLPNALAEMWLWLKENNYLTK